MEKETSKNITLRDYSLIGKESKLAIEKGLAEAEWYTSPIPREKFKELLVRKNGPAVRDTLIWFALIIGSGYLFFISRNNWWAVFPYIVYSALYASTSDSRWHESGHGTAFKSDWLNNVLYEIASFMVFRQSVVWRWSHTRHHSDTTIRGRDPEIAVPRPAVIILILAKFVPIIGIYAEFRKMLLHARGVIDPEVATYLPASEFSKVILRARIHLSIYILLIVSAIYFGSILPILFIVLPTFVGSWLMPVYFMTQHAGLAENVLDHRLVCRTVYMNRINRFLYWNMNYHIEHHMFPLVPYHALPKLHELMKNDCPVAYSSIIEAYKEVVPALLKQSRDPEYYVKRELPATAGKNIDHKSTQSIIAKKDSSRNGWVEVCEANRVPMADIVRFNFEDRTFALYHTIDNKYYATDGLCTHGNAHLADGLVIGNVIECSKHNGRFDIRDGSVQRRPVSVGLGVYDVEIENNTTYVNIGTVKGAGAVIENRMLNFKVLSNKNVTTFIKELILEPIGHEKFKYQPGDYLNFEIPSHEISFEYMEVDDPYRKIWKEKGIFRYFALNTIKTFRNYSMASNPEIDNHLRFNVRLALPPDGINCSAGVGSAYVFNLKKGDTVSANGPFGNFHLKSSNHEIIFIGGGAGMAPLKSQISYLFESIRTQRQVSYWYGARSLMELFYQDYFEGLSRQFKNFSFHVSLSDPEPNDKWHSHTGFIHEVFRKEYLTKIAASVPEYYLCGPPAMIKAVTDLLKEFNVNEDQIAYDEF